MRRQGGLESGVGGVGNGVGGVGGNRGNYGYDGNPQHVYPPPATPPPQHMQMQQQEQYHPQYVYSAVPPPQYMQTQQQEQHHPQHVYLAAPPPQHMQMQQQEQYDPQHVYPAAPPPQHMQMQQQQEQHDPQHVYSAAPPPQDKQMQQQDQHHPQQQTKSDHHHNQRRWDKDGPKALSPMSPRLLNEGIGSYYQGQRPELRMAVERLCGYGAHSQPRGDENMRFEEKPPPHTFEGVEQKFLDDIMKLDNEQNNAEDAEYTGHWERINLINAKHKERLLDLRARRARRVFNFLKRESHSRQQQYQQVAVDPQGYNAASGATPREQAGPHNPETMNPSEL